MTHRRAKSAFLIRSARRCTANGGAVLMTTSQGFCAFKERRALPTQKSVRSGMWQLSKVPVECFTQLSVRCRGDEEGVEAFEWGDEPA